MKRTKTPIAAIGLTLAAAMTPVIGWTSDDVDTTRGDSKSFVKDSAITTKIKASLAATHIASLAKIHVDTDANGIVWLSGYARDQKEIDQAVQTARSTEHVVAVKNEIKIRSDE